MFYVCIVLVKQRYNDPIVKKKISKKSIDEAHATRTKHDGGVKPNGIGLKKRKPRLNPIIIFLIDTFFTLITSHTSSIEKVRKQKEEGNKRETINENGEEMKNARLFIVTTPP